MEKEKGTIKCSSAVLVIVIFMIFGFVSGYAVRKQSKVECPKHVVNINEVGDNVVINNISKSGLKDVAHDNDYGTIVVAKDGNAYYIPYQNYKITSTEDLEWGSFLFDDYLLEFEENVKTDGYKINISNVKYAYSFPVGNGGVLISVVLITDDNKVAILDLKNYSYDNVSVSLRKIDKLSDIVTAVESSSSGSHGFILYDINGNQYHEYDL